MTAVAPVPNHHDPAEVVVAEYVGQAGRYVACIRQDDYVWSFDCTHLHHSVAAARKCAGPLLRRWWSWADADLTLVQLAPYVVVGLDDVVGRRSTRYSDGHGVVVEVLGRTDDGSI